MRLIDADALKDLLCSRCAGYGTCANEGFTRFCSARSAIDISPTIEAKPIVNGTWNYIAHKGHLCSVCGKNGVYKSEFCPNCGSRNRRR